MIGKLTIIEQGTQEWHTVRLGRFGGTSASLFATNPKKKEDIIGSGLRDAIPKKIAELVEGKEEFISDEMQRGMDLEQEAIDAYEAETFDSHTPVPYITYGDHFGVSLDGFVGDQSIFEMKCPMVTNYINYVELKNGLNRTSTRYNGGYGYPVAPGLYVLDISPEIWRSGVSY